MNLTMLTDKYAALAPRDQRILRIGAIAVLAILLLWLLLPLQRNLAQARSTLRQQQQDLEWMRQVGPALAAAGPGPAAATPAAALPVLVDTSARESGLVQALTSQPAGNGALRVTLTGVDFNLLVGWLARLSSQHGVQIEAASITGGGNPGIVDATVQLRSAS
jgi:type II secretory pathway component PulM